MLPIVMPSMLTLYSQDKPWTKKGSDAFIGQTRRVDSSASWQQKMRLTPLQWTCD